MRPKVSNPYAVVRRSVLCAALCAVLTVHAVLGGYGVIPKKSIVKVYVQIHSTGLWLNNRYIDKTKVLEETELNGFVGAEGRVVTYAGYFLPTLLNSGLHVALTVETFDDKRYPAKLKGVDERLAVVYLQSPVPGELAIEFSTEKRPKSLSLAASAGKGRWKIGRPCLHAKSELSWIPFWRLSLSDLDRKEIWTGSALVDPGGALVGLALGIRDHPFSSDLLFCDVIPAEMLRASMKQFAATGKNVQVGWLGVLLEEIDNRPIITEVVPDSPADQSGLQSQDAILEVDGRPVEGLFEFGRAIRSKSPGDACTLTIDRNGKRLRKTPHLGARRYDEKVGWRMVVPRVMDDDKPGKGKVELYLTTVPALNEAGLDARPISAEVARSWKLPGKGGLLVEKVRPGSAAQKAGVLAADVIVEINGKEVLTLEDAQKCLEAGSRDRISVSVVRDGEVVKISLWLE